MQLYAINLDEILRGGHSNATSSVVSSYGTFFFPQHFTEWTFEIILQNLGPVLYGV